MKARRSLSTRERLRLFELNNGLCHLCGGKIDGTKEAWDVEHETALSMGGADDDANRKLAHRKCHRGKTRDDLGKLAKAKRREARHIGAKKRGASFQTNRDGRFKKKLDGTIVRREPNGG